MVYCVAFNCKNGSFKNQPKQQKVAFFSFPEKNPLRQCWINKVRRKNAGSLQNRRSCDFLQDMNSFSAHALRSFNKKHKTLRGLLFCAESCGAGIRILWWAATRLRLKQDAAPTVFDYSCTETEAKRKHLPMRAAFAKRRRLEVSCLFTF